MPTSFRSVAYGATRHRVVRHPGPKQQYVSAAQAAARGALGFGQPDLFGNYPGGSGPPTGPGSNPLGGDGADQIGQALGLAPKPAWLGTHVGRNGVPVSNMYDPFAAYTDLGAHMSMS